MPFKFHFIFFWMIWNVLIFHSGLFSALLFESLIVSLLMLSNTFFLIIYTAWKVSIYGVFSGPYFPVFGLNTEIYWKKPCIWTLFTQWYYNTLCIFAVNCLRHFYISVLGFWLYIIKMILSRPVYASACLYGSMSILITTEKVNPQCSLKCSIEWLYFLNLNQITGVKCDTCHFMLKKKVAKATWQCYLYYHGDIICQVTSKTAIQHVLFFNFYIPNCNIWSQFVH